MTKYSPSRIAAYHNCPLKYKYSYIDKLEKLEESIEAFMGSRVHSALEELYKKKKFGILMSIEELIETYNSEWEKHSNKDLRITRKELKQENYKQMGENFLKEYYTRYYPFDSEKTIGLEMQISFNFEYKGKKYEIFGIIDRLAKNENVYEIHDYKTSNTLPTLEAIKEDKQLSIYSIGLKDTFQNVEEVELIWHYLAFDEELRLRRTNEELETLKKHIAETIDEIESKQTNDFKPKPSKLCEWCEYARFCPMQKHLYETEKMPANEFLKEEGVTLVNKYIALSGQKAEFNTKVEQDLENLKEALLAYAEKNNLQVISGSTHKIRIYDYEQFSFQQDSPERKEIEEFLEKEGLLEKFKKIDYYAIARSLNTGELPEKIKKKILEISQKETKHKLYPSKLEHTKP